MSRILPDWIESYLECYDNTEPPILFKKWMAISTLAATLRRQCWMDWDCRVYPNFYILLVGPSGCRKGTAMAQSLGFIRNLGLPLSANATTREKLVSRLVESTTTFIHPITENPTMHASLTIFSPESVAFLGYDNKGLIGWLADWFDCQDIWSYDTVGHGEQSVENLWVNIIGGITPVLLNQSLVQLAAGAGLTSRIIFVYGDKKHKLVPLPVMSAREQELQTMLQRDLEIIRGTVGGFCFTEDYFDAYSPWYETCEETVPFSEALLEHYKTRRSVHLRKLSMIMNISRGGDMLLTSQDFHRALILLEETERLMPMTFSSVGRLDKADMFQRILAVIATKKKMAASELLRVFHKDLTHEELKTMVSTLVNMNPAPIEIYTEKVGSREIQMIQFKGGQL